MAPLIFSDVSKLEKVLKLGEFARNKLEKV